MERSYCNHPVTRKYPWHKHNRNITMTLLKLDEISDIIVTWVYPSHVYSNVLQYNTIQPYCPRGEIPLAAIGSRRNIKHHINMIYLRVQKQQETNKKPTHSRRARQDWNTLKNKFWKKSFGCSMHMPTHIDNTHTHLHTSPSPLPTNTITYYIFEII